MLIMQQCNVQVERQHHELASGGQAEIDLRYGELVRMADAVQKCKYIIKNVARRLGKSATFMPKPLYGENGSGLQIHASLWKNGRNLFAGSSYAGLSDLGMIAQARPRVVRHYQPHDE
jgi:glutamine synthetase